MLNFLYLMDSVEYNTRAQFILFLLTHIYLPGSSSLPGFSIALPREKELHRPYLSGESNNDPPRGGFLLTRRMVMGFRSRLSCKAGILIERRQKAAGGALVFHCCLNYFIPSFFSCHALFSLERPAYPLQYRVALTSSGN